MPFQVLLLAMLCGLNTDDNSNEIVKRAIAAHGGKEKLLRLQQFQTHSKGMRFAVNGETFSCESWFVFQGPHNHMEKANYVNGSIKVSVTYAAKEDSTWSIDEVGLRDLDKEEIERTRAKAMMLRAKSLYPLLEDKAFTLKGVGEKIFEGRKTRCLNVFFKNRSLAMYIDAESFLLVGFSNEEIGPDGRPTERRQVFDAYKDFDGLKYPTKSSKTFGVVRFVEELIEFTPLNKVDEKLFESQNNNEGNFDVRNSTFHKSVFVN